MEDYFSASLRHLRDSRSLHEPPGSDNAAYLAGYVIECGLKRLLELYDFAPRSLGHDLQSLQGRALVLAALLAPGSTRYRVDGITELETASKEWSPEMRYWESGKLSEKSKERLMKVAAEIYEHLLIPMVLDGVEERLR